MNVGPQAPALVCAGPRDSVAEAVRRTLWPCRRESRYVVDLRPPEWLIAEMDRRLIAQAIAAESQPGDV